MAESPERPEEPSDEYRRRFERIRDELSGMDLPELPESEVARLNEATPHPDLEEEAMDARLANFESRLKRAKNSYQTQYNKEPKQLAQRRDEAHGLGIGLNVAYTIIGMPLLGASVGWGLDRLTGLHVWTALLCISGATLGVVIAILTVNKENRQD
ncbi:MAG: hypothetical protein P4L46_17825 [Fimbriimonas sp.]|nr:hypothetical protein [Fimbriimonas sp.]